MTAIELPDDLVAALKAKAAAQGLTLGSWFQQLAGLKKPRYSLSELIARCDADAPLSNEDKTWLDHPAVGREGRNNQERSS